MKEQGSYAVFPARLHERVHQDHCLGELISGQLSSRGVIERPEYWGQTGVYKM